MMWSGSEGETLEWAAAGRPLSGQLVSGDLHVVVPFSGGVLVAVIDGLGHGPDARTAASAAAEVILRAPAMPVTAQLTRCHQALRRLRGAVMSLASFDIAHDTLTWIGIGNVEGVLFRSNPSAGQSRRERLLLWGGLVGQSLPTLRPATFQLVSGDTIVFATDGICTEALGDTRPNDSVAEISRQLLTGHARSTDDALVVALRYGARGS